MNIIVPLAGPDYFSEPQHTSRSHLFIHGYPLCVHVLKSRPWYHHDDTNTYYVVLIDSSISRRFYANKIEPYLSNVIPIFLPRYTLGAMATVLAAISLLPNLSDDSSFLVDLADIEVDRFTNTHLDIDIANQNVACAYFFTTDADDSKLSYFLIDETNRRHIIGSAEKSVISPYASPGIYYFHSASAFMKLAACSLQKQNTQYKHFMTPLFDERANRSEVSLYGLQCSGITYY